jgi:predicted RNA binding protein YcfA (HicA-like mRNA interferase family)
MMRFSPWSQALLVNTMKVRDVLKRLEKDGWLLEHTRGSHRQYSHLVKRGPVTVSGHERDEMPPGTLNSILKKAGLK